LKPIAPIWKHLGNVLFSFYPHHIGDFNKATRHLTRIERSVYRDLLDLYYDTETVLASDFQVLCRKIIAHSNEEATAVEQVLKEFFTLTPTGWYCSRCDAEITKYKESNSNKSKAGKASAKAKEQKKLQMLNGESTHVQQLMTYVATQSNSTSTNQEPITNNQEPVTKNQLEQGQGANAPLSSSTKNDGVPPCPHDEILSLWKQHLPSLVQPRRDAWKKRRKPLEARWAWLFKDAKDDDGRSLVSTVDEGLAFFEKTFKYIPSCPFLVGAKGWEITLDWLLTEANFFKVIEGNYDRKEKA
jgi:uncharacterized protein YdaU (DUF1376 family)